MRKGELVLLLIRVNFFLKYCEGRGILICFVLKINCISWLLLLGSMWVV